MVNQSTLHHLAMASLSNGEAYQCGVLTHGARLPPTLLHLLSLGSCRKLQGCNMFCSSVKILSYISCSVAILWSGHAGICDTQQTT